MQPNDKFPGTPQVPPVLDPAQDLLAWASTRDIFEKHQDAPLQTGLRAPLTHTRSEKGENVFPVEESN